MNTLKLKNTFQTGMTMISNDFIDRYMIKANGEFVKVYLFLLRHMNHSDLTISVIADCLNNTENDILRAFRYWETEGLLRIERDKDGAIIGLELVPITQPTENDDSLISNPLSSSSSTAKEDTVTASEKQVTTKQPDSLPLPSLKTSDVQDSRDSAKEKKELKSLLFIAEQYLNKTLSHTDVEAITYFYKDLGMSARLIEYLIESCVENGHKSIHYIQKVALSWSDEGIQSVEQARHSSATYNKNCYTILNSFGIKNRGPADSELAYIRKWTNDMGFSLDIIQEACRRTISATHQPSFEYTDTILERWQQNKVRHLEDITALDAVFQKERNSRRITTTSKPVTKNMNNFERRTYDMESLEEQLLNSN